ncbi:MAG: DNA-directed RNA polymerase subunit D [Nanoarchaeota archaeon]|nr:DNA-directed RNA polymerase subunit D [Nanoarchaeota archaeon]MBU1631700.1 DNA-directed RNA polymerase subunit D [Nanoarchaeota archaeon]MBU1876238.1 DNA-directed RNA polymerase subunit D [Nanoarchaeota archaeon]
MKCEKIKEEKKKGKLTFLLKGSNEVFANTIRRLIIEEVPTLAVEDVEVKDNSSSLSDEMLALRLGLIPIKTDLKSYRLPKNQDEVDEKVASCTLQLKLKSSKKGYVYAKDTESSDPKCNFVYEEMPVVKLLSKQKLDVTMTAVMGMGKDHTKWSPGLIFYKKEPVLKLGKVENPAKIAEVCTDGLFKIKDGKVELIDEKVYDSKLLEMYAEIDKGITLEYSNNIVFNMESWGQLTCKEMLSKSAEILIEKTEELSKLI